MKRKYEPLLIFFTLFVIAIVIGELVTGCTFSFTKTAGASSYACKDDDLSGYILNLVFQTFIIVIMLIWNYLAYAKKNSNKQVKISHDHSLGFLKTLGNYIL